MTAVAFETALPALDPHAKVRLTFPRVVRSELIKLRSLRAVTRAAVLMAVCSLALGALVGLTLQGDPATMSPHVATLLGLPAVQIVVQTVALIMGVLFATVDYTSGAIRPALAVVPRRWSLLLAKLAAAALALVPAVALSAFGGLAVTAGFASAGGYAIVVDGSDLAAAAGLTAYGVVLGLIGFLLGFATRSAVAGIGVGIGFTFILPMLMALQSGRPLVAQLMTLLPEYASRGFFRDLDATAAGLTGDAAIVLAWLAAGTLVTGLLFSRRDA
jgi:ABC-2 type transport system permease protein